VKRRPVGGGTSGTEENNETRVSTLPPLAPQHLYLAEAAAEAALLSVPPNNTVWLFTRDIVTRQLRVRAIALTDLRGIVFTFREGSA